MFWKKGNQTKYLGFANDISDLYFIIFYIIIGIEKLVNKLTEWDILFADNWIWIYSIGVLFFWDKIIFEKIYRTVINNNIIQIKKKIKNI